MLLAASGIFITASKDSQLVGRAGESKVLADDVGSRPRSRTLSLRYLSANPNMNIVSTLRVTGILLHVSHPGHPSVPAREACLPQLLECVLRDHRHSEADHGTYAVKFFRAARFVVIRCELDGLDVLVSRGFCEEETM